MKNNTFAKLANYSKESCEATKDRRLSKALDGLAEILGIEFGSLTVRFFNGKWSPKIEIQKNLVKEIEDLKN